MGYTSLLRLRARAAIGFAIYFGVFGFWRSREHWARNADYMNIFHTFITTFGVYRLPFVLMPVTASCRPAALLDVRGSFTCVPNLC